MPKPTDVFIGVIDFFAILLPGVLVAAAVAMLNGVSPDHKLFWPVLLTAGYIIGHLAHAIGSLLDPVVYDRIFQCGDRCPLLTSERPPQDQWLACIRFDMKMYPHQLHALAAHAGKLVKTSPKYLAAAVPGQGEPNLAGSFQWARAYLRTHNPAATAEIDRIEADSKLFRSLAVVLIPTLFIAAFRQPAAAGVAAALIPLCLWRYCDLRQKMVRACYLHYVQLRATTEKAAGQPA